MFVLFKEKNFKLFKIIISILLLTLFQEPLAQFILAFILTYEIVTYYIKNLLHAVLISLGFVLFLFLFKNVTYTENFDNNTNNTNIGEKEKTIMDKLHELTLKEKVNLKEDKKLLDDIKENDVFDKKEEEKDAITSDEYVRSTQAQKETFRLINTIKQLEDTLGGLAPTIKQGAKVIEQFKRLNLVK